MTPDDPASWVVVSLGKPNCVHKWEERISFVYGQMRICKKKRCRQSECLHKADEKK